MIDSPTANVTSTSNVTRMRSDVERELFLLRKENESLKRKYNRLKKKHDREINKQLLMLIPITITITITIAFIVGTCWAACW